MTTFVFANNINTGLASSVSSSATTITLSSGANLPASIPSGSVLAITLNDAATQQIFEVVYATAISGTTLTVQRAQEGTTPQAWAAGDYVFSGPTAGQMEALQSGIGSGVTSWNTRTGAVDPTTGDYTWTMIGGSFPYVTSFNSRVGTVVLSGSDVITALGYTPGTVTSVTVASENGVSASVANQGTTPSLTFSLGAITPNSIACSGASSAASYAASGNMQCAQLISGTGVLSLGTMGISSGAPSYGLWLQAGGTVNLSANGTNFFSADAASGLASVGASLAVNGSITASTMNATSSDGRLKRDVKKAEPRPLHRSVPFVSYVLKESGWHGLGSTAQAMKKTAPQHVGEFYWHGKKRLSLNYAGAAYEEAMWAGRELDRQAKFIEKQAKLIAKLATRVAKLERRK